jgi:hypothetical protein
LPHDELGREDRSSSSASERQSALDRLDQPLGGDAPLLLVGLGDRRQRGSC